MTVLLQKGKHKCDGHCYNASSKQCKCICGGKNHGIGFNNAFNNSNEQLKEDKELKPGKHIQLDMFHYLPEV